MAAVWTVLGAYSSRRSGVLIRHDGSGWGGADTEIEVTYDAGFDTVPGDIQAVVETAALWLTANPAQWRSQPAGLSSDPEGPLVAAVPDRFRSAR